MGQIAETIKGKLKGRFEPLFLEVVDQSHLHKGHVGAPEGGESHFRVKVVSKLFGEMSRLERQRAVNEALKDELAGPVHALSIQALAPDED